MNYFEQMELAHYGSFELHREVGPNLMKGLLVSFIIHTMIVVAPIIIELIKGEEEIPPPPVRVVDISQLTKLKRLQESTAEQIKIALPKLAAPKAMIPIAVEEDFVEAVELLPTMKEMADIFTEGPGADDLGLKSGEVIDIVEEQGDDVIPDASRFIPFEIPPQPLDDFSPAPSYPKLAGDSGVNGYVVVLVYIDKSGTVRKVQIKSAKPEGLGFEEEVLKVIEKWRFTPAIQNKTPVGCWIEQKFTFNVEN